MLTGDVMLLHRCRFDPFRLGANPSTLPWLVEGELYNG